MNKESANIIFDNNEKAADELAAKWVREYDLNLQ